MGPENYFDIETNRELSLPRRPFKTKLVYRNWWDPIKCEDQPQGKEPLSNGPALLL